MNTKRNYDEEASNLVMAIDIAIEAISKFPPISFTKQNLEHFVKCYKDWRYNALNPEPQFRKVTSLNYIVNDVFTFFQEGHGEAVNYFWSRVQEQKLPYKRENKMVKILARKKLKNRIEYDYVIDSMVAYHQQNIITEGDLTTLNSLIADFENRRTKA